MNIIKKTIELPDGRVIEIETGKLAKQAAGSAVVKMGGTMLLATVTCATEVKEGTDFMPLVFVNVMLISAEKDIQPDALAGLAASAALATSDLPFGGPVSEVRVARIDGQFVINPGFEDNKRADLDLMVAATEENIMMVEGERTS